MSTLSAVDSLTAFHWEPQPAAQRLVNTIIDQFLARNGAAQELARRMKDETGTRFVDWVGHITIPPSHPAVAQLEKTGYELTSTDDGGELRVFRQPRGMFPAIVVCDMEVEVS